MPRPRSEIPTPTELTVLNFIYTHGPSNVNEVWRNATSGKRRAYTSVMSLMSVMFSKGLLDRKLENRAYLYSARIPQAEMRKRILDFSLRHGFAGSPSELLKTLVEIARFGDADLEAAKSFCDQLKSKTKNKK
jgi:BlaI family transcriptional regulator, penicillinase repressor